ncbi:MAG TPA: beta-ketoacyl-[acyl-carrier-protein] synthase family protein [Streptosporangiaceae bacterium]|nr:beta-ketoacyl-[acyl-carrier-protein] synthase family protein [Streptosporangiaceae bacterium]
MSTRRPVITGAGVVSAGAVGTADFWSLLISGSTATRGITHFDPAGFRSRIAAECDFDPEAAGLSEREATELDRAAQFALTCAREALADSRLELEAVPRHRMAVVVGSAVGCTISLEREYLAVSGRGARWEVDQSVASPLLHSFLVPSSVPGTIAAAMGVRGRVSLISNGCTSGLDAVCHAARLISDGTADVAFAGACDAPISPITMACFDAIKATSPDNHDPAHASRPFDMTRNGFVLGEGAAMFVIEELAAARERGAHVYAEVAGYASRANALHMTGLDAEGQEMSEAINVAMSRAGLGPADIDYVNAHGSGTRQNDRHETAAFKRSLGEHAYRVPVSSIKSAVGHSLGAIGAVELAACALAIDTDVVPPTANLNHPDPDCDLDYVPINARKHRTDTVLSVGSGFGGFQTAVILQATPA